MRNDDNDTIFRLIACDGHGNPASPIPDLPGMIAEVCTATAGLYDQFDDRAPWRGYVAMVGDRAVGFGAFVAPPSSGRVEIAYLTLPDLEGNGFAGRTASRLVTIARTAVPGIGIFAKTMPEPNASTQILKRLGFRKIGTTTDHEIGEAWAWLLDPGGAT